MKVWKGVKWCPSCPWPRDPRSLKACSEYTLRRVFFSGGGGRLYYFVFKTAVTISSRIVSSEFREATFLVAASRAK